VGATGFTGFIGSRGLQGFVGSVGFVGSQGTGFVGSRGTLGFTGSQGAGFTGSRGEKGFTGSEGSLGYTGSSGATGPSGIAGFSGSVGAGYTGSEGTIGYTGSIGYAGSSGAGFTGSQGTEGPSGPQGLQGLQGVAGFVGSVGGPGPSGPSGPAGPVGYTGSSAEGAGINPSLAIINANTWTSTSTTTGALQLAGGAGIQGNVYVGESLYVTGNILPTSNNLVNLGSPTRRFNTLYVSANTIDIGGGTISLDNLGQFNIKGVHGNLVIGANTVSFLSNVASTGYGIMPPNTINLYQAGPLKIINGTMRWYAPYNCLVTKVYPRVVSSADAAVHIRLKKNDNTLITLVIGANQFDSAPYIAGINMLAGDYFTVDVIQIGSSAKPGAELYVQFQYQFVV
jgi:hypothetical protein